MGVNGEALQLHAVYKKPYFLLQVTRKSVSVLQVTWESVSGTASHARCIWTCNEIEGSYDKIIITIAPSYTGKNITRLLPLALLLVLRTHNNTDGNKLVIFCGIAWYYGDNYIICKKFGYGIILSLPACSMCMWITKQSQTPLHAHLFLSFTYLHTQFVRSSPVVKNRVFKDIQ